MEFKDRYEKICKLGKGGYGKVFKCLEKTTGNVVAVKKFQKYYSPNVKEGVCSAIISEIFLLKKCNHPSIIKIIDYDEDLKTISFPLYDETLDKWIDNNRSLNYEQKTNHEKKIDISYQILEGLNYLHSHHIVHRDIKPNNILLKKNEENGNIDAVICDFSVSFFLFDKNKKHEMEACCFLYRPPECIGGYDKYGFEIDMWAFGIVFAEMFSEWDGIFTRDNEREQLTEIFMCLGSPSTSVMEKYYTFFKDIKHYKPCLQILRNKITYGNDDVLDLITKLLNVDPQTRWSANMALQHSIFSQISKDTKEKMFLTKHAKDTKEKMFLTKSEVSEASNIYPCKKQDDITPRMLKILISWMAEVCQEYVLSTFIFFRAVRIMMEYLNLKGIKREEFQLLGVTSLLIASKLSYSQKITPEDMSYITDTTFSSNRIFHFEKEMLILLKDKIYSETFIDFLEYYEHKFKYEDVYHVKVLLLYLCAYFESFQYDPREVCKEAVNVFLFKKYGDQKYIEKKSQLQEFIISCITVGTKKDIIEPLYEFFDSKKLNRKIDRSVLNINVRKEI